MSDLPGTDLSARRRGPSGTFVPNRPGKSCLPIYRDLRLSAVPRRVCDRRIYGNPGRPVNQRPWGTRIVFVSVPAIRFLEAAS